MQICEVKLRPEFLASDSGFFVNFLAPQFILATTPPKNMTEFPRKAGKFELSNRNSHKMQWPSRVQSGKSPERNPPKKWHGITEESQAKKNKASESGGVRERFFSMPGAM